MKNLTFFKSVSANNIQHVATPLNRVAKRAQQAAPNNVEICCVEFYYHACSVKTGPKRIIRLDQLSSVVRR